MTTTAASRWDEVAKATSIPADVRPALTGLLAAGTTIGTAARALGVSRWETRCYLERLRYERAARIEGTGRTARWGLASTASEPEPLQQQDRGRRDAFLCLGELALDAAPGLVVQAVVGQDLGDAHQDLGLSEKGADDGLLAGKHAGVLGGEDAARGGVEIGRPVKRHEPVLSLTVLIVREDGGT